MKVKTERICIPNYVLTEINAKQGIMILSFKPKFFESVKDLEDWK